MSKTDLRALSNQKARKARMNWIATDIPDQTGRLAVVTGTGGLGFEYALALAQAGAHVIIAGRNAQKGREAVTKIQAKVPRASIRFEELDLANLKSVADFTVRMQKQSDSLDLLINNAAVMRPPKRVETKDGFELQFATNYLGHFALTAQLMPLLGRGADARVVTLSSIASRNGLINLDDLQALKNYDPMSVYSQSKLACLMFAFELQRRSEAGNWGVTSIAAHPGISRTELLYNAPGRWSVSGLMRSCLWFLLQPASQGALPILFAATSPQAIAGGYYGPANFSETRGLPAEAAIPKQALDLKTASLLWETSEKLADVMFAPFDQDSTNVGNL